MELPVMSTMPQPDLPAAFGPRSIAAVRVLRISLTDRCNYRCVYCMPEDGVAWMPREQLLSFEEIADVVRASIEIHGIRRFKLTGGEPTLRHGLCDLVSTLRRIDGVQDLSLTTNGQLLEHLARPLAQAGLDRVTVSLDSLDPQRFRRITRTGDLATVLRGLDAAEDAGLKALKINCVTMRGTNDTELPDFARLTLERDLTVRFIEYMPLGESAAMKTRTPAPEESGPAGGCGSQDRGDVFISEDQVRASIVETLGPLVPIDPTQEAGVGPAKVFRLVDGHPLGRIGFISAMSQPFCSTCNRLRLTADGTLRSCLFDGGEVSIRGLMRSEANPFRRRQSVAAAMERCVAMKPVTHSGHGQRQMSQIGG